MDTEGSRVHIDRVHQVAVTTEAAVAADPVSSPGFVCMLASGTPAAGASFGPAGAQDASLFGFMREVIDIASVFPQRHAAVVVPTTVPAADAGRRADEERPYTVRDAELYDGCRVALCERLAHAPFGPAAHLVLGALEFLEASGMPFAAALLFGELAELPGSAAA